VCVSSVLCTRVLAACARVKGAEQRAQKWQW
jgi:hypothetical protein